MGAAAAANDDAVSTVVPPSLTKDEGAYVGVSVSLKARASEESCRRHHYHHRRAVAQPSPP